MLPGLFKSVDQCCVRSSKASALWRGYIDMATFEERPGSVVCDHIWTLGSWNKFWSCLFNVCPKTGKVTLLIICILLTSSILISDMVHIRGFILENLKKKKRTFLGLLALLSTILFFILRDISYIYLLQFWVFERHGFDLQSSFIFLFIEYKRLMLLIF